MYDNITVLHYYACDIVESECFLLIFSCMNPPFDFSLNILEVIDSLGKSDLEVSVE